MEGILTACLYSFGCPELKQIGAEKFIFDFIKNPEKSKTSFVKDILEKLEPFIYYKLIGKMNKINSPFNLNVVRAHWLGNSLLKPVKKEDIEKFSKVYILKLSDLVSAKPHHNFSVFWSANKIENISIEKIDKCLIKPGKVIEIKENMVSVETVKLSEDKKEIFLENCQEEISRDILRGLIGFDDWVSIHFGAAREKISRNTAQNLIGITKEAISFFKE